MGKDIISIGEYTKKDKNGREIKVVRILTRPYNKYSKDWQERNKAIEENKKIDCGLHASN